MKAFFKKITERITGNTNTIENNLKGWGEWDWSKYGEEWSNNPQWKESVLSHILHTNAPGKGNILEIGPGAGRWTEALLSHATNLTLVDLVPKCIDICKERFKSSTNIQYFVNDGKDLSFIPDKSIDFIWSWDVFVHISAKDVKDYIKQFSEILTPGGKAVIHHSKNGRTETGWRSDMTADKMHSYCREYGLAVIQQFDSWDNDTVHIWPGLPPHTGPDVVSILVKLKKIQADDLTSKSGKFIIE